MSARVIRETGSFRLSQDGGRFQIECKDANAEPSKAKVDERDAYYLKGLSDPSFDGACVFDFGVGVFQRQR